MVSVDVEHYRRTGIERWTVECGCGTRAVDPTNKRDEELVVSASERNYEMRYSPR